MTNDIVYRAISQVFGNETTSHQEFTSPTCSASNTVSGSITTPFGGGGGGGGGGGAGVKGVSYKPSPLKSPSVFQSGSSFAKKATTASASSEAHHSTTPGFGIIL